MDSLAILLLTDDFVWGIKGCMRINKNHNKTMLERFKKYLIEKKYSEFTPSGKPSTVYDYIKRIERIRSRENLTLSELAKNISYYVDKYGPTGNESEFGKKSHNAFINALRRFGEFLENS